jgi:hypothetical protein
MRRPYLSPTKLTIKNSLHSEAVFVCGIGAGQTPPCRLNNRHSLLLALNLPLFITKPLASSTVAELGMVFRSFYRARNKMPLGVLRRLAVLDVLSAAARLPRGRFAHFVSVLNLPLSIPSGRSGNGRDTWTQINMLPYPIQLRSIS